MKWDRFLMDSSDKNIKFVSSMHSEVIVGKNPSNFDDATINKMMEKMRTGSHNVPTSYKSTAIDLSRSEYANGIQAINIYFKNSKGKSLKIVSPKRSRFYLINNQGKRIGTTGYSKQIGSIYCAGNTINLRVVRDIRLENITNEYGELQELPLMFWLVETRFKATKPSSSNTIDF